MQIYFLDDTGNGNITIETYVNENNSNPVKTNNMATYNERNPGFSEQKNWKRIYLNTVGVFVQFKMTMSNLQMINNDDNNSDFVLHAMNLNMQPSGRRLTVKG